MCVYCGPVILTTTYIDRIDLTLIDGCIDRKRIASISKYIINDSYARCSNNNLSTNN